MESQMHEVEFNKYCEKCKYGHLDEKYDPCNECLDYGYRQDSRIPKFFEEKTK